MTADTSASAMTNMDIDDSKFGYSRLSGNGSRFQNSVNGLRRNPFKLVAAGLGLLCVFLLAGVIGQHLHYRKLEGENQNRLNEVTKVKDNLQENLKTVQKDKKTLQVDKDQLQGRYDYLSRQNNQLQTNANILKQESNDLKVKQSQLQMANSALSQSLNQLNSSQQQLQTNNKALTKARDLLDEQHKSVVKLNKDLQTSYDTAVKERNNLENKYNNATRSREQLQLSCNLLTKTVENLQKHYNISTSEKEKLASSHQNLTKEMAELQASYDILVKVNDQLQASYTVLLQEKEELLSTKMNVTAERDQLKMVNFNLTAERDKLQQEVQKLNTTIQDKPCPAGWKKFQYSCYYAASGQKSWHNSRLDCQNRGADLVIITSEQEMSFINGLYSSDSEVWIGLTDEGVEGQWVWVDGTPLTKTFWAKGQPNSMSGRNQDCVEFWHRLTRQGEWNDESCSTEAHWICEM
ncbi:CD209 antigen-like protein B [Thalassophryne amazonica]|uniref:CD209 antigen-like protein B n=1 Tax=Thalassophryne amazonica TaxID=390379 RepID=UPI00147115AD|nr:CD209 antigen-like protein B [Thalassophryne amazonica]